MDIASASPASQPLAAPDDDAALTRLHPNYPWALRVAMLGTWVPLLIGALVVEFVVKEVIAENPETAFLAMVPQGALSGTVLLIALLMLIFVPQRRYNARGYHMSADRLRVVRGVLWHSDTVVPFGRVQHIDVHQGPVERFFGLATLTLHTAGNHNASVNLPGLGDDLARTLREDIRAHIKRDSL
jgi:membrane protein YdbS with pleckstrin-like domain